MSIFPVIMCGGAGTRLWPASRPARPKQFIPLAGNRSLFQETVIRVASLADKGGELVVVGGVGHRDWILDQLAEVGLDAHILLEPEPRDSAAAMAAAALWTEARDPSGINVFVSSDHHVKDDAAFRSSVMQAVEGAATGRIVTLGVKPTEPSSAYGYIKPTGPGLSAIEFFREKPDIDTAKSYINSGYLWNSGNFIVRASTLVKELQTHAPGVEVAVRRAMKSIVPGRIEVIGGSFGEAPKISIDYAVMERTNLASVLEVEFDWSDLGAWDAVAATGEGDVGQHIFEDVEGCLVRAPDGVLVAALGVKDLAIIAEKDAVLVCNLSRSQDVKQLVARIRTSSPQYLDFARPVIESLSAESLRFSEWLRLRALPLWSSLGQADNGAFAETLSLEGRPVSGTRRARVQARQVWTYSEAGRHGWGGPWKRIVADGVAQIKEVYLRPDGLCRALLNADGTSLDDNALVYDQAFVMLALEAARSAVPDNDFEVLSMKIRDRLLDDELEGGGFKETGRYPYQSNAHMHLLEACLAWEEGGGDAEWGRLADRIVGLARRAFIDPEGGFLREFFCEDWTPAEGDAGRLVEPGHQFEWAWLLARYSAIRNDATALDLAWSLYAFGIKGVTERDRRALDAVNDDGRPRGDRARLWPQTEWLKASLILSQYAQDGQRTVLLEDAASAMRALWFYLTPEGLWRDKRLDARHFINEAAPASSFYHIMAAFGQLSATGRLDGLPGFVDLSIR